MEKTHFLEKFTDLVRYDKLHNSSPCLLIMTVCILNTLNCLLVALTEQKNLEKRLLAAKEFFVSFLLILITLERSLKPQKTTKLLNLIESDFLVNRHEFSERNMKWKRFELHYNNTITGMEKTSQNIRTVFVLMFFGFINRNIVNEFLRDLLGFEKSAEDLPVPCTYWNPDGFNSYVFFAYLYILQSFMITINVMEIYCVQIAVSLSTKRVLADFETIYILIDELEKDFPEIGVNGRVLSESNENHSYDYGNHNNYDYGKNNSGVQNEKLKTDIIRIARCHQSLIRNLKDCEMSSGSALLLISMLIFIDTCTEFYLILKADNMMTSINYAMSSLLINLAILFPYHTGQRIADQNDILRQHLSNLPWIDKPEWFKKILTTIMIRANVDIVIQPFGVHYLNHVSFKNMIRVSFSFGNFLYNTKFETP